MLLSTPTIEIVVLANFLALSVAWAYVARSYPDLNAARFWQASSLVAATTAAITLLRNWIDPLAPIFIGNTLMMLARCLAWNGLRQFYGRSVPWTAGIAITLITLSLVVVFTVLHDDITARILIGAFGQSIFLGLMIMEFRDRPQSGPSPGAELSRAMIIAMMISEAARAGCALAGIGGLVSPVSFNGTQAIGFLVLLFSSMMVNFGFMLMAIDRLRADVAALALVDDLTGIANRRHFLVRLADACARAAHVDEPLTLLVIDLDGFKAINDGHGHGAGDACLRAFTRAAQARLRDCDLFARTGGDEFCVILPSTNLEGAALLARDLVKTCRRTRAEWNGEHIPLTVSVGVAAWSSVMGLDSQMLITAADQALYSAKKQGRDRLALAGSETDPLRLTAQATPVHSSAA